MAHPKVVEAITTTLKEAWDGYVFDENEEWNAPTERDDDDRLKPFIILQFPFNSTRQVGYGDPGNNLYRERGAARVVLQYERGLGAAIPRQWCEDIAVKFRGTIIGDGVNCVSPTSPVRDDYNEEGSYYRFAFEVVYWTDIRGA